MPLHDAVDVEIGGDVGFDDVQEGAELARPMAGEAFADDPAGGGVERREQAEGSVTRVVMRAPLDLTWAHRKQRLRSIERLNLALFVDAEDNGTFGRRKVKADDVTHFFDEQGIGRQLEGLGAMRLKAEGFPDSVDRRGRQSDGVGQRAQAPVRRVPRRRLQRQTDDLRDLGVATVRRVGRWTRRRDWRAALRRSSLLRFITG
jgi:hypothetical protein